MFLGSSIAIGLANHGATVAIVGRNLEKAEDVVKEMNIMEEKQKLFQADVSARESLIEVASAIEKWSGGWDILLNAPGKNRLELLF